MRKAFGGSRGMGGGSGGGGGGGSMLRTVQRAVRAGVGGAAQEPFSHSTITTTSTTRPTYKPSTSNILSLSSSNSPSSPFSSLNLPISPTPTGPAWSSCSSPSCSDEFDWECIDGGEDQRGIGFYDNFVFGSLPSNDEVQHAVSALQQVLDPGPFSHFMDRFAYNSDKDAADQTTNPTGFVHGVPSAGSELDWIEPSLQLCNSRMLQPHASDSVYAPFHLLQTEPTVKRMVISLSSDKAVWDAVMNNEVVRELRESLNEADNSVLGSSDDEGSDDSKSAKDILSWIFTNLKAKVTELINKVTKQVNELFKPPDGEKATGGAADLFEEKLRTSFLLSVVVLLIVVMTRAHRA